MPPARPAHPITMTDPLEHLSRPGVNPRLFLLAVALALILAAASLWWLTGPEVQVTRTSITASGAGQSGGDRPTPEGPSGR